MSLRASVAPPLDLPNRLWAERASDALAVVAVCALAWVSARLVPAAASLGIAVLTAAALVLSSARPRAFGSLQPVPGRRTRRLGPTLVVEGSPGRPGEPASRAWLTPGDLPPETIRRLTVRLWAEHPKAGS